MLVMERANLIYHMKGLHMNQLSQVYRRRKAKICMANRVCIPAVRSTDTTATKIEGDDNEKRVFNWQPFYFKNQKLVSYKMVRWSERLDMVLR